MEGFQHILTVINSIIWGIPALILLGGTGIFLTFFFKFIQWRGFIHAWKLVFGVYSSKDDAGQLSHFRALMTGLSATIGTGNIAGVAAAIMLGGPGAIFWMWFSAMFGMATKFTSCTLAVKYRHIHKDGEVSGGPMYTLLHGLNYKTLAYLFAIFTVIASFGIGNTVQANSIVDGLTFILPGSASYEGFIGIIIAFAVGAVILGGITRIGRITSIIVPVMSALYLLAGLLVLILNFREIPHAFYLIFDYAFNPHAVGGGMIGAAIQFGMARGIFSNEAGLGSSAIAHATAQTEEPVREGLVAMLEPFIDTIVICTFTALVILVTNSWQPGASINAQSTSLTADAFSNGLSSWGIHFSYIGSWVVGIGIVFFAYSSMITWCYYGDRAIEFLFGHKAIFYYRIVFTFVVFFGAIAPLRLVWQCADLANIFMAVPNLISLIVLAPLVKKLSTEYFERMKASL